MFTLLTTLLFAGCSASSDPLQPYDKRYTEIMVRLGAAERDTARNVRNKEARQRRTDAESARIAFLRDEGLSRAIEQARAEDDAFTQLKADAYARERQIHTVWTEEEKKRENHLLAKLEEIGSQEASWSSPDGAVQISLNQSWADAARESEGLSERSRQILFEEFIHVRMQVVGETMQQLVTLRNQVAQRAGYDNYWTLSLAEHGLTDDQVMAFIGELRTIVDPLNASRQVRLADSAKVVGLAVDAANQPLLVQWSGQISPDADLDSYFDADMAEERIVTAFREMGVPADSWQIYTEPRRYARAGAYGYPIRPPNTVAIVISQDRRWSTWQYEALAHEGAHAVWWQSLPDNQAASPPLWSPPAPWGEGFAGFFERLTVEESFTTRYLPDLPPALRKIARERRVQDVADRLTDGIIDAMVEKRLYEQPEDLVALTDYAAGLRAEMTGMPRPPTDERGLHYAPALLSGLTWIYPGYSANFLYAYATECQLFEAVTSQLGDPVANAQVGPMLRERIIQADPTVPIPERIAALLPEQPQTAALQRYFAPLLEAPRIIALPDETAENTSR
ncbi:MAG: hypothetical protein AAFV53_33255 [Myxococcota bacterium]